MPTLKLIGEGKGGHSHSYSHTVTGDWLWCETCKCFVTSQCDHSRWPCKERAAQQGVATELLPPVAKDVDVDAWVKGTQIP